MAMYAERPKVRGEAFNFGPQKPFSVIEIVETIQRIMNCNHLKPVILNNATNEIKNQILNSAKANKVLGWNPRHSLESGLIETVKWYEHYLNLACIC
jgi:nucleoside-diphosphate-sugar epimerase